MNVMVGRIFYHRCKSTRPLREFLRLSSTKEPCSPKSSETKEAKTESNCPQQQTTENVCPPAPPCAGPPPCPSRLTNFVIESGNPCNYVPPQQKDPDYPDMTRIKRLQCKFQEGGNEIPVYLRGGRVSVLLYHFVVIVNCIFLVKSFYILYQLRDK